jgi:RimJ/RimL family protein N-acetyltransferase
MAKKKKKAPTRTQKKASRIARARNWLPTYEGTKVVRAYRKKFHVDTGCAVRELQEIGYVFQPGYVDNLLKAEAVRIEQMRAKKEERRLAEEYNDWQDDRFYFIAGYTSGGAPYGTTWEEMGLSPYEEEFEAEEGVVCYRDYDFLNKREKDAVDSRLRDGFSRYVGKNRRLPSREKQKRMIEKVFESCPGGPLLYSKDFNKIYRKIVRKRENKFIREGVLPKRFTPTEVKKLFEQSVMLESERLIFRKITGDDFADLAVMLRDPEVTAAWEQPFSDEEIQKWIANQILRYRDHIVGYLAAIEKDTGAFIGQMGLMWSDFDELRVLEVGYMLKRAYWGMGYATEGASALARYGFTEIGVNKVYASIRPENQHSIRVAERIGMRAEGSFIKTYQGKEIEHICYAMDRDKTPET